MLNMLEQFSSHNLTFIWNLVCNNIHLWIVHIDSRLTLEYNEGIKLCIILSINFSAYVIIRSNNVHAFSYLVTISNKDDLCKILRFCIWVVENNYLDDNYCHDLKEETSYTNSIINSFNICKANKDIHFMLKLTYIVNRIATRATNNH